jgi:uncharacterized damage-inducible protein DinB
VDEQIDAIWRGIAAKIDDLLALARGLTQEQLNAAPDVTAANTPFVIVTHVLGNIRAWVPGIVCEQPLERDRPAEFRSHGTMDDLEAAATILVADCDVALGGLDPATLSDRIIPRQVLFGEGETREITRFEALLHPLEHAALHAGQLQLTVDLLQAPRG